MGITIDDVKKNVAYKQLPLVILDERWHKLFPDYSSNIVWKQWWRSGKCCG